MLLEPDQPLEGREIDRSLNFPIFQQVREKSQAKLTDEWELISPSILGLFYQTNI
jgi:hypothetical protein